MKATEIKKGFKFYIVSNGNVMACRVQHTIIHLLCDLDGYWLAPDRCPSARITLVCETPEGVIELSEIPNICGEINGDKIYASVQDALRGNHIELTLNNSDVISLLKNNGCRPTKCIKNILCGSEIGTYKLWTMRRGKTIRTEMSRIDRILTDGSVYIDGGGEWYNTKEECESAEFPKIKVVDFAE